MTEFIAKPYDQHPRGLMLKTQRGSRRTTTTSATGGATHPASFRLRELNVAPDPDVGDAYAWRDSDIGPGSQNTEETGGKRGRNQRGLRQPEFSDEPKGNVGN